MALGFRRTAAALRRLADWLEGEGPGTRSASPADDQAVIAASSLFDATLYLVEAPDIREAGYTGIDHFCLYGEREGRRPNLYFDPLWYRERHGIEPGENALAHYVRTGEAAGLAPICYFDPAWYARTYRLPRGASALAHYLAHRRSQRYAPNPHFDPAFYLGRYGAQVGPNRDPFTHLLRCGATRDLDPSAGFDSAAYRRDVMMQSPAPVARTAWAAADLRVPLVHYLDARQRSA